MEYYKVYCQEHPYEAVTNFCADPACLIGLCATCICEHTQSHIQKGTNPSYENVKNTYTRYNERMRQQIQSIEQDKTWLNSVCLDIEEKRRNVRSTISKARQDCLSIIDKHFNDLQAKIESQIASEGKKNSLHSAYRLETLNTLMNKQISNLLLYSKDLSSGKFLETAKLAQEQIFPSSQEFHFKVSKELKQNEVYRASAIYRSDQLNDLVFSLKKLINLEFLLPKVEYVSDRVGLVEEVRRSHSLKKNNSAIMMQRPSDLSLSNFRNMSIVQPKHATSVIIPSSSQPLQQLQQFAPSCYRQSELISPTFSKNNRLSSGLRIIRESKRESALNDQLKSLTSSSVSYNGKENDGLAHSTYYDSGSSFFKA